MDACAHGLYHVIGSNHCVKDKAKNREGGSLAAGHLSDVRGSGDGEVFGGNTDEFAGAVKPTIDETIFLFGVGCGWGGGVVPSERGREDGKTRLSHGRCAQGREA